MSILSDPRSTDDHRALVRASATDPLVDLIRGQQGMADRLLAQHVDDGHGRCAVCRGGAQTGRYAWPCTTARAAVRARAAAPLGDGPGEVGEGPTDLDGGGTREVRPGRTDFIVANPARTCHGRGNFGGEVRQDPADFGTGRADFGGEIRHDVTDLGGAR